MTIKKTMTGASSLPMPRMTDPMVFTSPNGDTVQGGGGGTETVGWITVKRTSSFEQEQQRQSVASCPSLGTVHVASYPSLGTVHVARSLPDELLQ